MNYSTIAQSQAPPTRQLPIKQPIAKLPAFSVLIEIFSYYGLNEDVCELLHILSRSFRKYIKSGHRKMLMNACVGIIRTKVPAAGPTVDESKC